MSSLDHRGCTAVWLFAAATSLCTTKHLLDHRFHFPMHLVLLQLTCVLALRLIRWFFSRAAWPTLRPPRSLRESLCDSTPLAHHFLRTLCVSGAFLCSYQAILHSRELPVVVMILSLDWRPMEARALSSGRDGTMRSLGTQMAFLIGVTLLFVFDFHPSVVGIEMSLLAVTFVAVKASIQELQSTEPDSSWTLRLSRAEATDLSTLDLLGALASALFWCHFREQQFPHIRPYSPWLSDLPILALNLVSSTLCLTIGGSFFRGPVARGGEHWPQLRLEGQPFGRLLLPVALVCLVTIGRFWSTALPPLISPWQLIGFSIASLAVLPVASDLAPSPVFVEEICQDEAGTEDRALTNGNSPMSPMREGSSRSKHELGIGLEASLFLLILVLPSCVAILLNILTANPSFNSQPPALVLDGSFQPARALDIVVARYDEPASEVSRHITELFSLQTIQRLRPSIIIYDKSKLANSSKFFSELQGLVSVSPTPNITVHALQNIGRESDTYLEHITSRWSDLATHTLFMQAEAHYTPRAYLRQIRDYFVPSTGFLSLAETGRACATCDPCYDRDWTEQPGLLDSLFQDFNHGADCGDVVLTYRGQFIASAARIRGNDVETYRRWLRELRDPQGFLHTAPYTQSVWSVKTDSLAAPRVGYTLERTWGMMLQCNQRRIADRCPTFLSGFICPPVVCGTPALEDCQCLD